MCHRESRKVRGKEYALVSDESEERKASGEKLVEIERENEST